MPATRRGYARGTPLLLPFTSRWWGAARERATGEGNAALTDRERADWYRLADYCDVRAALARWGDSHGA